MSASSFHTAAPAESLRRQMLFSFPAPFVKKADQPGPQAWLICNIKKFPLIYSGCGSLQLLHALDGTRILQAAAPTAPSCFCRWQRSSLLQSERGGHFKSFN